MNIYFEDNSSPAIPLGMEDFNIRFAHNPNVGELSTLVPTPINPALVIPVANVSLDATLWNLDESSLLYLKQLSFPEWTFDNSSTKEKASSISVVSDSSVDGCANSATTRQESQAKLWNRRYSELLEFYNTHGHCLVPLRFRENPALSHWVKRQRYQHRVKREGKHSTLDEDRQAALETIGFVWNSHAASWEERWNELRDFRDIFGHTNVPKTYDANQQLAIWVKSRKYNSSKIGVSRISPFEIMLILCSQIVERRHYRLYSQGKSSTMSAGRIEKLLSLGFLFSPRSQKPNFAATRLLPLDSIFNYESNF